MPLTRSASNPNYFALPDGTPVYLTGSHTWNELQNEGSTFPPASLDYTGYLNWMQSNNFNFMRLWNIAEQPYSAAWTTSPWYTDPLPYARTGPGLAADGKPKFDLNTFNQAYFDRLRDRVIEAGQHGIYVDVMLFEGWSLDAKTGGTNPWTYHPYNINNNTNGINGDPFNTRNGDTIQTTSEPAAVLAAEQAYIRKVIDTVGDLDNVLYEISNEGPANSEQWQYNMINYVKNYEAGKGHRHPVGMTAEWPGGSNSDLFNSPADWVSPNSGDGYIDNPPANNGSKVVLTDTDHIWGGGGDITWVWKSFTRGLNPIFMDDLGNTGISLGGRDATFNPSWYSVRLGMTETANYADRMDLRNAKPNGGLSSTGYMLANPGTQYLAFAPNGGSFTVNLSTGSGSNFSVEWLNVQTGNAVIGAAVTGGSSQQTFTAPFNGSAALFLNKVSGVTVPALSITADQTSKAEGNSGTTPFTFTVTRSGSTAGTSSVSYAVSGGTANAADFGGTLPSGTVSFAAGETSKTVTLKVSGDTTVEPDESFNVVLSSPAGATIGTGTASSTILNDDVAAPALSITAAQMSKLEGASGPTPFTFTVTRSGSTAGTSSASYAVSGGTANAADFGGTLPSGTVSFAAGETSKTITVNVSGDTTVEPDESFNVVLSSPAGATIGTGTASSTILNDDVAATALSITADQTSKLEGNSGTTPFTFTVTRSGSTAGTSLASYAVSGGTANAADFGGTLPSGTVSFAAGETSKTITVNVSGDTTVEPDESFNVVLSSPAGATIGTGTASSTILNDDV